MSDDQNPAPQNGNDTPTTPAATPAAPAAETFAAPPAPPAPPAPAYDAPATPTYEAPGTPTYEAPGTPTYDTPAPEAAPASPAYGAPAYGAPAAPTYGAPAYGSPAPYGSAPYGAGYSSPARTNVLAIISLVASIAGFIWVVPVIGPIAGVITGHIALAQIKRTGENGRGMALAGTIVGWVGIGVLALFAIFLIVVVGIAASQSSRYGA